MMRWRLYVVLAVLCALPVGGQGLTDYLNVESPQVHPIEVATVDGHPYLLVCNTPDNAVEIWDTDESLPLAQRFVARIRVGLEPVSVRFDPVRSWFYSANFLGDSISIVELSAPGGPGTVAARLLTTTYVGDEPVDIAFYDRGRDGGVRDTVFVTHMTLDAYSWRDAVDLSLLDPAQPLEDAWVQKGDVDGDSIVDRIAIKEPRAVAVENDCLMVLGMKGGHENTLPTADPTLYDFDLFTLDLLTGTRRDLGLLGSTNANMRLDEDGVLWVVGGLALNDSKRNEPVVMASKTGFVKHMIYAVENPCSASPTIHARDVNLVPGAIQIDPTRPISLAVAGGPAIQPVLLTKAVKKKNALALLRDVVVYDPAGGPKKVFFSAFGNDRVGVVEPNLAQNPINWKRRKVNVTPAGASTAMTGVRGLALVENAPGTDQRNRLYSVNRIENALSVIDADTETWVASVSLNHDPRPAVLSDGQRFLYDARLGNGFNACASCHTDARTDGLSWDLGTPGMPDPPFPLDKEFMVTQSLQGLLNFELDQTSQQLVTNAPYHWRTDRPTFLDFNGAFVGLLGGTSLLDVETEMKPYEGFINTIHYPPNPYQPTDRRFSGDFGTNPDDLDDGSGALRGLKVYHMADSDGRSCNHCHSLFEGSDNLITENFSGTSPFERSQGLLPAQPMETAAMRGLLQKEMRLDREGGVLSANSPITGHEGLLHTGFLTDGVLNDVNLTPTLNGFNRTFFAERGDFCGPGVKVCPKVDDLNRFVHEFDWGIGPLVGRPFTVDDRIQTSTAFKARADNEIGAMEAQALEANNSVAVQAWIGGVEQGFWLDVSVRPPAYRTEPWSAATFNRGQLYSMVTGTSDRLVFQATPLGSEQRVAAPTVTPSTPPSLAVPKSLSLLAMRPNTGYRVVPQMTNFWARPDPAGGFFENHGGCSPHVTRVLQWGLIQNGGFGLPAIRWDAPRRFRVSGKGIQVGATLHLFLHDDDTGGGPPIVGRPPEHDAQPILLDVTLPIYATNEVGADGLPVWETAVELEPITYYTAMLGGPFAPDMADAFDECPVNANATIDEPPAAGQFTPDPANWNFVYVRVVNPDGATGEGGWQRLTVQ